MAIKAFANLRQRAFAPVDIASIAFFRIAFGSLMVWEVWRYFSHHRIERLWLKPDFLFTYYGFSWVHPFPGNWLYLHCGALIVAAFFIAIGFLYRPSVIFFCLGWTYTFLLDEQQWVNHIYLICLFSFLLFFVPAHRAFSVDAWLRPRLRRQTASAWTLWILRFQMAVVYFYAGIAKLSPDWIHAVPMWQWLSESEQPAAIHRFLIKPWVGYAFSYSGLVLDLFIVPFLLWRRTRVAAFWVALLFHLVNQQIFYIEVFPFLAIVATTLFLSPSWPRRILSLLPQPKTRLDHDDAPKGSSISQSLVLNFFIVYALVQVLVPLRHFLYRGGVEWYYSEHRFSWRMLVQRERTRAVYYVEDPNIDETTRVTPDEVLEPRQAESMGWRPDEMVQFARYLTRIMPQRGPRPLRVEARIMTSINGRKPELIIDPNVDLAAEPWPVGRPRWLREIHEPTPVRHGDAEEDPFEPDLLHMNK